MKAIATYIESLDPNVGDRMVGYVSLFAGGFLFAMEVIQRAC